jgi:hypothetical protein
MLSETDEIDHEFDQPKDFIEVKNYKKMARLFKFQGDSISNLCKHNSQVARSQGYFCISHSWNALLEMYEELFQQKKENQGVVLMPRISNTSQRTKVKEEKISEFDPMGDIHKMLELHFAKSSEIQIYSKFDIESLIPTPPVRPIKVTAVPSVKSTILEPQRIFIKSAIIRPAKIGDFKSYKEVKITHMEHADVEEEFHCKKEQEVGVANNEWACELIRSNMFDIMFYYSDKGDLLTSSIMLLVFRNKIPVAAQRVSSVLRSYINLLTRLEGFSQSAEVIKYCYKNDIQNEYGKNWSVSTKCQYCKNKESGKEVKWYLDKCGKFNTHCSIWDIPVQGRFWWCQLCGHGGHAYHMKQWFLKSQACPTGWGHECINRESYYTLFNEND